MATFLILSGGDGLLLLQLYIGVPVMPCSLLFQGFFKFITGTRYDRRDYFSFSGITSAQTDVSDLMVKFKRVDWAGAISLILTVFSPLVCFIQRWKPCRGTTVSPFTHLPLSRSVSFVSLLLR